MISRSRVRPSDGHVSFGDDNLMRHLEIEKKERHRAAGSHFAAEVAGAIMRDSGHNRLLRLRKRRAGRKRGGGGILYDLVVVRERQKNKGRVGVRKLGVWFQIATETR